ncbi:MAG TPA: RES family NAD+ phosphorylase, partial [Candidatus Baltobacteraceae bacterium]|nr:RES family NAD+ phosphorylase [Candidatus Baltobacteraceae bacterium]
MRLYRVFPHDPSAAQDEPGGALFIPNGGAGRFDNPKLYKAFYAALEPQCAIVETLGEIATWDDRDFMRAIRVDGTWKQIKLALATYEIDAKIVNLARIEQLAELGVTSVTEIVTRQRRVTQAVASLAFAHDMFNEHAGLAWWSFYLPEWSNVMLWNSDAVTLAGAPETLNVK